MQDLQTEIDSHRDVYGSLVASGQKLCAGLDSAEEASALQCRLDQMNHRWNYLKNRAVAIKLVISVMCRLLRIQMFPYLLYGQMLPYLFHPWRFQIYNVHIPYVS